MTGRVIEKQYVVGKGMALAGVPERQSKATGQKIIEDKTPPRVRSDQENRTKEQTKQTDPKRRADSDPPVREGVWAPWRGPARFYHPYPP